MRFLMMLLVLVIVGCSKEQNQSVEATKNQDTAKSIDLPEVASLGVTIQNFSERFNAAMVDMKQPFRVTEFQIDNSDNPPSFKYFFNNNIGLIGSVTPDSKIIDFTMIGTGEGTMESGLNIMFVMNALIRTVNPEMSKQEAAKMVLKLMEDSAKEMSNNNSGSSSIILNGLKYTCSQGQAIGTWLIVTKP